tara:strand:+ start:305 stop:1054 length:750 start_codon:yes stop_codon:yes gene_type:complete
MSKNYVDTSKLSVREIPRKLAKEMIIEYHYSKQWTKCSVALGLYHLTGKEHQFFDEPEEKLIGTICYGDPIGRHSGASISESISRKAVFELVRLFVHDGYGSNIESYLIGEGFKWLKQNRKDIKALISYSDPQQGHVGTIYQATNWLYQGNKIRPNDSWLFKWEEDGKWQHGRTIFPYYGTNDIEKMRDLVKKDFWVKKELRKHRYIYLLVSKNIKRKVIKDLKHPILPYPKVADIEEVKEIKIKVNRS